MSGRDSGLSGTRAFHPEGTIWQSTREIAHAVVRLSLLRQAAREELGPSPAGEVKVRCGRRTYLPSTFPARVICFPAFLIHHFGRHQPDAISRTPPGKEPARIGMAVTSDGVTQHLNGLIVAVLCDEPSRRFRYVHHAEDRRDHAGYRAPRHETPPGQSGIGRRGIQDQPRHGRYQQRASRPEEFDVQKVLPPM